MSPLLASIPSMVSYLERTVCLDWTCMQVLILLSKILRDMFKMGPTILWNCNDCNRYFSNLKIRKYLMKSCVYKDLNVTSELIWPHCINSKYAVKFLKDKF